MMNSILSLLPVMNSALNVIGAFRGDAAAAKGSSAVQDAAAVISAVAPLVQQFANGTEVTPEQVRAALAGKDAALSAFDDEIARRELTR